MCVYLCMRQYARPLVVISSSCHDSSSPLALAAAAVFVVVGVRVVVGVGVGCRWLLNGDIRHLLN
jgi:hypothetical protein